MTAERRPLTVSKPRRKPGEKKGHPTSKQVKRDMQHPKMGDRHLRGAEAGRRG